MVPSIQNCAINPRLVSPSGFASWRMVPACKRHREKAKGLKQRSTRGLHPFGPRLFVSHILASSAPSLWRHGRRCGDRRKVLVIVMRKDSRLVARNQYPHSAPSNFGDWNQGKGLLVGFSWGFVGTWIRAWICGEIDSKFCTFRLRYCRNMG